jgi:hypothetical protein
MHTDDASGFLVDRLSKLTPPKPEQHSEPNDRTHRCDVWIPDVGRAYWQSQEGQFDLNSLADHQLRPFYDAAWELCRIGVLRPGRVAPKGQAVGTGFLGDEYVVTAFGWQWLKEAERHPWIDPNRLADVLVAIGPHFGPGYKQRAREAVRCYRTQSYLAACVLAGAAAESILLAVAVAKTNDEAKVLADYKSSRGRERVLSAILGNVAFGIAQPFREAHKVLQGWRDEAGHGTATTISEIEAHTSLTQLLRLAQFTADHWDKLRSV